MVSPNIHTHMHTLEVAGLERYSFEIPSKHYQHILARLQLPTLQGRRKMTNGFEMEPASSGKKRNLNLI